MLPARAGRLAGIILGSLLLLPPLAAEEWDGNLPAALERAKQENRPVMVDVYAPWCGFCRKLREEVYPTAAVRAETARFVTVRINGEQQPDLMQKYGITGFPTILFLDQNGILIERLVGYQESERLARILRDIFRRRNQEEKVLAGIRQHPRSVEARYLAGVYFYEKGEAELARKYFLEGWNLAVEDSGTNRRDCLYNAAVTSMDLRDYVSAVSYWNIYLSVYAAAPQEAAYARYFRGIAYKYIGRDDMARPDLDFASRSLTNEGDRRAAERALKTLQ